jgi:hypothetical protein
LTRQNLTYFKESEHELTPRQIERSENQKASDESALLKFGSILNSNLNSLEVDVAEFGAEQDEMPKIKNFQFALITQQESSDRSPKDAENEPENKAVPKLPYHEAGSNPNVFAPISFAHFHNE